MPDSHTRPAVTRHSLADRAPGRTGAALDRHRRAIQILRPRSTRLGPVSKTTAPLRPRPEPA